MAENSFGEDTAQGEIWLVKVLLRGGEEETLRASKALLREFVAEWRRGIRMGPEIGERVYVACDARMDGDPGEPKELYLRVSEIRGMVLTRVDG